MTEYHKINAIFKRYNSGPNKGKLIMGDWAVPEIGYLADNQWEFTEKVDGTNIRVEISLVPGDGDPVVFVEHKGRTDNADIPKPLLYKLEEMFPTQPMFRRDLQMPAYNTRYRELKTWMSENKLSNVVLYGEGYGPKIQNGGNYRDDVSFVLFDVKIGDFWLDRENVNDVAEKLGIDAVPVLGKGTIYDAIQMVRYGTRMSSGEIVSVSWDRHPDRLTSMWGNFEAEGIVARPVVPLFNRKGERIIAKIKARDFR